MWEVLKFGGLLDERDRESGQNTKAWFWVVQNAGGSA